MHLYVEVQEGYLLHFALKQFYCANWSMECIKTHGRNWTSHYTVLIRKIEIASNYKMTRE